jgi:hypothetical protein
MRKQNELASSDAFDFDGDDTPIDGDDLDLGLTVHPSEGRLPYPLLRRELRWFYVRMRGRVPAVGEAPARDGAAASRIAGWLSELHPGDRGAFFLRYDGRTWPVRLVRQFGGLTSVVVRFATMRRRRGPKETVAEAERAAVAELLEDIAEASRPLDLQRRGALAKDPRRKLARLRRGAHAYVRTAEEAYFEARGDAPCAVPSSREGA